MSDALEYPESSIDADVLDAAASILERRGRARGQLVDENGCVCAVGAIGLAVADQWHSIPEDDVDPLSLRYPDNYAFDDAVLDALKEEAAEYPLPADCYFITWRDKPEFDAAEYLAWCSDKRYSRDAGRVPRFLRRIARTARGWQPGQAADRFEPDSTPTRNTTATKKD